MHFLGMARGSILEVQTQLELAQRLNLGVASELEAAQQQATELIKILNSVISTLRNRRSRNGKPSN
jgi:four helix bundle protein